MSSSLALSKTNYMIQFVNNVSIILLENHMYSECFNTFHDVLDFMKKNTTTTMSSSSSTTPSQLPSTMLEYMLDNATQRLCTVCMEQQNHDNVSNEEHSGVVILDIDSDDSFDIFMKIFTTTRNHSNNTNNQDILLRINHHYEYSSITTTPSSSMSSLTSSSPHMMTPPSQYHEEQQQHNNIDINYAILLYNYCIACKRYEIYIRKQNQRYDPNGILMVVPQENDNFIDELDQSTMIHSRSQLLMESLKSFEISYRLMIYPLSIVSYYHMNHNDNRFKYSSSNESSCNTNMCLRIVMISTLITMNICTLSYNMC